MGKCDTVGAEEYENTKTMNKEGENRAGTSSGSRFWWGGWGGVVVLFLDLLWVSVFATCWEFLVKYILFPECL